MKFHPCPNCGQRNLYEQRMLPPHPLRGSTASFHCRHCNVNAPGQGETFSQRLAWAQAFMIANQRRHELIALGFGRIGLGQSFEAGAGFTLEEAAEYERVTRETDRLLEPLEAERRESNARLAVLLERVGATTAPCPTCAGTTFIYRHHRQRGNSRRYPLPCPECQDGGYRITEWIEATPGTCGGRPCFRGVRFDVRHIIGYLTSGYTPERMAREWELPVAGFEHILALHESGRFTAGFWEAEYDPRERAQGKDLLR